MTNQVEIYADDSLIVHPPGMHWAQIYMAVKKAWLTDTRLTAYLFPITEDGSPQNGWIFTPHRFVYPMEIEL